jgi:uncharacterized RDD family membrane protein YckC
MEWLYGTRNMMKNLGQPVGQSHAGRPLMAAAIAVALALPATPALAATVTWDGLFGASEDWSDSIPYLTVYPMTWGHSGEFDFDAGE